MSRSIFACPVCALPLCSNGRTFICNNNHAYDISKEGYVNLLLANMKQSREPGDSKEMLDARRSFLNMGYYKPLAEAVTSLIVKHQKTSLERELTVLDAGCGEGYYSDYISKDESAGEFSNIYGIDISKEGIKSASKRNRSINFAVGGIYNLPVLDNSVDILINIFAPFNGPEFHRVLNEKGCVISVTPGACHLYELKRELYDEVYLNDEEFNIPDRFYIAETVKIQYELGINNNNDISSLLKMTPYYHKTEPDKIRSFIDNVRELKTTADFIVRIITKKNTIAIY